MTLRTWSVTSTLKYCVCYRNDFAYLVRDKYRVCYRNDFAYLVGEEYLKYFDLNDLSLDVALRCFLKRLTLTGETQECERILAHFSNHYVHCNSGVFNSEGTRVWRVQYGWRVGVWGIKFKNSQKKALRRCVVRCCKRYDWGGWVGCQFSTQKNRYVIF